MPVDDAHIEYWLATSAIQFTGTHSVTTYAHRGGWPELRRVATASQMLRADQSDAPLTFDVARSLLAKSQSTLKFTTDGRLAGSEQTSAGRGLAVITAVVKIAAIAAKVLGPSVAFWARNVVPQPPAAEPFPQADELAKLRSQLDALRTSVAELDLAQDDAGARGRLDFLDHALKLVTAQYAALEAAAQAWEDDVASSVSSTLTYVLDAGDLPTDDAFKTGRLKAAAQKVWDELGIMATLPSYDRTSDPRAADGQVAAAVRGDGASLALWYRRPRRTTLSIWRRTDDDMAELVSETDVELVDKHCPHFSIQMDTHGLLGTAFANDELSLTFGPTGTPTAIGTTADSGVSDALAVIAAGPETFAAGYSSAQKAEALFAAPDPMAQEIATLTAQIKLRKLRRDAAAMQ